MRECRSTKAVAHNAPCRERVEAALCEDGDSLVQEATTRFKGHVSEDIRVGDAAAQEEEVAEVAAVKTPVARWRGPEAATAVAAANRTLGLGRTGNRLAPGGRPARRRATEVNDDAMPPLVTGRRRR